MPSASLPLSAVVALGGLMLSGVLQAQSSPIWQSFPAPDQSPHSPIAELHLSDDGSALSLHRRNLAKLYLTADLGAHWQVDSFEAYGAPSGSSGPWAVASHSLSANGQILRALVGTLSGSQLQVGQIPWRGWPVESLDGGRTWRGGPWHQTAKPSDRPSMVRLLLNSLDGMAGFAFSSYQLNVNSAQEFPWVLLEPTQARLWEGNNAWGDHFTLPVEWISAACSADGKILLAVVQKTAPSDRTQRWRHLVTSSDWGRTWVLRLNAGSQPWNCCAVSANGTVMLAAANPGGLLLSRDSGSNWSAVQPLNNAAQPWSAVALSTGGQIMAALTPATLTASTDGGAHWAALRQSSLAAGGSGDFLALAMTHSGAKLAVADNHGDLHLGSSLIADTAPLPFGLSLHPQSCNTNVGTAATLRIALLGADENTQVTWYTGPSGTVSPALKTATGAAGLNFQTDGQLSLGAHSFWARIQNAGVTVDSFAAIVKVAKPLRLRLGARPTLKVVAAGGTPHYPLQYQWYRGAKGDNRQPLEGARLPTYQGPSADQLGEFSFWVRIYQNNSRGELLQDLQSEPATLSVQP